MAANTSPIFGLTPNVGTIAFGSAANTKSNGDGTIATDIFKAWTSGSNGSYVESIRLIPVATTAATNSQATVHRIFISTKTSGSTTGGTDTFLIQEVTVAAQSADSSSTGVVFIEIAINKRIASGYTILVSTHVVNNANQNWHATVWAQDF